MVDGADAAEKAEQPPEQGHSQDVGQVRLGVGQEVEAVGDQVAAADDNDVAQEDRGPSSAPPNQVEQAEANSQRNYCYKIVAMKAVDFAEQRQ